MPCWVRRVSPRLVVCLFVFFVYLCVFVRDTSVAFLVPQQTTGRTGATSVREVVVANCSSRFADTIPVCSCTQTT